MMLHKRDIQGELLLYVESVPYVNSLAEMHSDMYHVHLKLFRNSNKKRNKTSYIFTDVTVTQNLFLNPKSI